MEPIKRSIDLSLPQAKLEELYKKGIIILAGQVDDIMAMTLMMDLLYQETADEPAPLVEDYWIIINSWGGSLVDGLAIYDTIRMLVENGKKVNTVAIGHMASIAVAILEAGSRKYAFPHTQFTVHQASLSGGEREREEVNKLMEEAKEVERLNGIVLSIIAKHSGMDITKLKEISNKTDVCMDVTAAKAFGPQGLIDEIITTLPFLKKING